MINNESKGEATFTLGDQFDVNDFHDVVIGTGALPLPILKQQVKKYIASASN